MSRTARQSIGRRFAIVTIALLTAGVIANRAAEGDQDLRARIDHHRNLGKAFYENPTTQLKAVDEFKAALDLAPDSSRERLNYGLALLRAGKMPEGIAELQKAQKQDPKLPHTWFNLGIVYKKESEYEKAIEQLEGMEKLVPDEAVTRYNLGVLYKLTGRATDALREFEASAKLDPNLAGPRFQLYNSYRLAGRAEEAAREEQVFHALKKMKTGAAVPEDLDWSFYAEIHDVVDPSGLADDQPAAEVKFASKSLGSGYTGIAAADLDGDGKPELIAFSPASAAIVQGTKITGLDAVKGAVAIAPADFDNDGAVDLCIVTQAAPRLLANRNGAFTDGPALPAGSYRAALWVDYDHDYDLDLFLLGDKSVLLRNGGKAGFTDETASFPFVDGAALGGVSFDTVPDTDAFDIAVSYRSRPGVVYRDRLGGKYTAEDAPAIPAGATHLAARDFNNDGWTDLAAGARLIANRDGKLETARDGAAASAAAFADLENRAFADLVITTGTLRNQGVAKFTEGVKHAAARALIAADFDADGREDIAAVTADGEAQLWKNETETPGKWLAVRLTGVKNLKLAPGAEVEVKAGSRYQKQTYAGLPLHFGMRSAAGPETVRITWANGLVQNETGKTSGSVLMLKEAPRLSGSCPMIFTWNGKSFQFISDVLAVAPLGASAGDGTYFATDHDEYVQIPRGALAERDGAYEVRITEELREVSYLDQVKLVAVDHPARVDLYTNDKFKSPPFPDFRLFGVTRRIHPAAAHDHRGRDVRESILRTDRAYAAGFTRDHAGNAEKHWVELDFNGAMKDNRGVLILNGWVDWADGSSFRAASQESADSLAMPYLQVKNARGEWTTVINDMGIPAGKAKSIAVDLTGKFLTSDRRIRIVTGLCVYWDEIFASEDAAAPETRVTTLAPAAARLDYRGFSQVIVHPDRVQPERFVYGAPGPATAWNPTPGNYTRFGDVRPLLGEIDDKFVVMGAGDEMRLSFNAALPPLAAGWTRDFLLFVDGWAKDGDANTAFAKSVDPLPFHGMSSYPYPASEHYPDDAAHREYLNTYNTRPALRLLTTLRPDRRKE
ncbi:MAG: FG-GAP-like repeat-containing protein [Bryobacteraceae bacterium]